MGGDGIDEEAQRFWKEQDGRDREDNVSELMQALHLKYALEEILGLIKEKRMTLDTPMHEALEIINRRMLELVGMDPDDDSEESEEGSTG